MDKLWTSKFNCLLTRHGRMKILNKPKIIQHTVCQFFISNIIKDITLKYPLFYGQTIFHYQNKEF